MPTRSNKKKMKEKEAFAAQQRAAQLSMPAPGATDLGMYGQGFANPHPQEQEPA